MLLPVKGFYRLWFVLLLTLTFQGSSYWYHPLHKPGEWKGLIQGNEQLEAAPGSAPAQPSAGSRGCFHPEKVDSGMMYRAELSELVTHQPALPCPTTEGQHSFGGHLQSALRGLERPLEACDLQESAPATGPRPAPLSLPVTSHRGRPRGEMTSVGAQHEVVTLSPGTLYPLTNRV